MAATIRHNRARGRHQIHAMSEIVRELAQLGWCDEKIGKELGWMQTSIAPEANQRPGGDVRRPSIFSGVDR
jgi:ParB-like chromosome segregation protein Spo0J